MKNLVTVSGLVLLATSLGIAACSTQDEMVAKPAAKPAAPAPAAAAKTEEKLKLKPRQREKKKAKRRLRQPSWREMWGYWTPKRIT